MSITRYLACLSALSVLLVASTAPAQREIHHVPPYIDPDGYNPDVAQPFIEPFAFDPDFQFFAPAEFGEFGGGVDANTGWFATYDRLYMYVTRPEDQAALTATGLQPITVGDNRAGDFTWGNRYDVGYMTEEDHGWLTSFWHIDGPNYWEGPTLERIDVYDALDQQNNNPNNTNDLRSGTAAAGGMNPRNNGIPERDANDPITGARDFRIRNSVNVADLSSFEFNKTFRIRPLHYGSIIEPFFGFRYMKFQDYYRRDAYERFNNVSGAPLGTGLPIPPTNITLYTIEDLTNIQSRFDNHMVGGQLGMRWFKQKERWNLSGEIRAFAFQNFQSFESQTDLERVYYATLAVDAQIQTVVYDRMESAGHSAEFVFGTEVRAEANYALTRDFSLRVGMSFLELARGIGRGNSISANDQDVTMVGANFGFTVNR